jgi:hypothetical protein
MPVPDASKRSLLTLAGAACLGLSGCTDSSLPLAPGSDPHAGVVEKQWESNAAVEWNEQASNLAALRVSDVHRMYAYLGLAQLRAAEAAAVGTQPHPPISAAIGGASAVVLEAFFPADVATIEAPDAELRIHGQAWNTPTSLRARRSGARSARKLSRGRKATV